jgi:anti-sigma regulatory factor (Ser/Thr protein kinase)
MGVQRRSRSVGPDLIGVRVARRFVVAAMNYWHVVATDDIALVTSELVTNALMHAEGPVRISIERNDQAFRFEVSDGSAIMPLVREVTAESPHGRGMRIVELMVDRWGADTRPGGKTVWAEIDR